MGRLFFVLFCYHQLMAEVRLDRLIDYDRHTCAGRLQAAELSDLWNWFLKGQADLFFGGEAEQFASEQAWVAARNILEIGSGNGAYLHHLAETFPDKTYLGVDKQLPFVAQSNAQFGRQGLAFEAGDAEVENTSYAGQFDAVLFRLTLQHLKNPRRALEIAHKYLPPNGSVFIIDSCDAAQRSSFAVPIVEEASRRHNERNRTASSGNRRITTEILEELQNRTGPLNGLYEVARTSVDVTGNPLEKGTRFESEQDRRRYFNHCLLFLAILNKGYEVPIDFEKAYDELSGYIADETSWVSIGMHFLVLKKIEQESPMKSSGESTTLEQLLDLDTI